MFRLIGFLFGVVITVVALAVAVDAPTRERAGVLATDLTAVIFNAVERLKTEYDVGGDGTDAESAAVGRATHTVSADSAPMEELPLPVAGATQNAQTPSDGPAVTQETLASAPESVTHSAPPPERQQSSLSDASAALVNPTGSPVAELSWEPVWRAFRSELSAKGFAGHLERLTGQGYRVRRTSPWAYQVELPYFDEAQRDAVLDEIQSKTGLLLMKKGP